MLFAQEQGLPLAVRSGGHDVSAKGTVDGGVVLDLSLMRALAIDPIARVARVQPGLTWGEYAEAAQAHGLVATSQEVKRRYDPTTFFRLNQNITPKQEPKLSPRHQRPRHAPTSVCGGALSLGAPSALLVLWERAPSDRPSVARMGERR